MAEITRQQLLTTCLALEEQRDRALAERDAAVKEIDRLRDNPVARRMKAERDEALAEVDRLNGALRRGAHRSANLNMSLYVEIRRLLDVLDEYRTCGITEGTGDG